MRFCGKLAQDFGNRINPDQTEKADDKVSKGSHQAGSISGSNPGSIFFESDVPYIVQSVLNAPMIAIQGKKPCGVGF